MELNVNDYVRTKQKGLQPPQIAKIKDMKRDAGYNNQYYIELDHNLIPDYNLYIYEEDIAKTSPNTMDLIEEHDILKIEEQKGVYTICEVEAFREPYDNYDFLGVRLNNNPVARKLYELNIKSIVTKEQLANISYKVGE